MGQRRVVKRAGVLADPERLAADLEHQRLRDRVPDLIGGGDAEAALGQARRCPRRAGERHRRMDGQGDAALLGQRGQHADAVGARRVDDDRARPHRRGGRRPDTRPVSSASGTASSNSSARPATSSGGSTAVSGSLRSARSRDAREIALRATTTCSERSRATPSAVPRDQQK